jgi:signal transduction histidine kinase
MTAAGGSAQGGGPSYASIGALIEQNAEALVDAWSERVSQAQAPARRAHAGALRDELPAFLRALGAQLASGAEADRQRPNAVAARHGRQRWQLGWSIAEVVRDYQVLQVVVLEFAERSLGRALGVSEMLRVGCCIDAAIEESVAAYVDCSSEELAQLRRQGAEALADVHKRAGEFVARLGRDLRDPLTPIQTATAFLQRQVPVESSPVRSSIDIIDRQSRHLRRLIDDLLELGRMDSGALELQRSRVDCGELLHEVVDSLYPVIASRNHRLRINLPAQEVEVEGDRVRLKRMLGNLVANAAKYTVPGGEVAIDLHREGDDAVIQVRDNGIGMPKEMLDRICEALAATATIHDGLLGVGLAFARRVVQAHGGAIGCHSDGVGRGTRFVLRLPLRPAP